MVTLAAVRRRLAAVASPPKTAADVSLGDLEREARDAVFRARAFAAFAALVMVLWPTVDLIVDPDLVHFSGHILMAAALVVGAFAVAVGARKANVRVEQHKRITAEVAARRDELSGLYNSRYMRERLHAETVTAARDRAAFAYVVLDLDNFTEVNDRFGHTAGDDVVAAIGRAIEQAVADRGVVARMGGDEFALLVPDVTRRDADALMRNVGAAISSASTTATGANGHIKVTASYGVALFPSDGSDPESLTAAADRALRRAKSDVQDARSRSAERHSQDVFFAVGEAIGESLEPGDVPRNICRAVARSLDLDACAIWLIGERGRLIPRAWHTDDPEMVGRVTPGLREQPMMLAELQRTGLVRDHAVYIDDASASGVFPERFTGLLQPETWLVNAPLPTADGGMMMLAARHGRSAPPETGLALAIAQLAAAAITNAATYDRARRQAEQLSQLAGLGGLLTGESDFEDRLNAIARRIVEVTRYPMVTIDTGDPTGQRPFVRSFATRGDGDGIEDVDDEAAALWRTMRPALTDPAVSSFLAGLTAPIVFDDPANQVPPFYRDFIARAGIRSVVIVPSTWRGELKALFYFASYRPAAFDEHDIAMMQTISAQLAPSLQVAQLHVELEHSYGELKSAHLHALLRLAYAAEARDPYTECHLQRIRAIAQAVAARAGVEGDALEALGYGAIVHDLGKLRIPDSILINPGALSDAEWEQMKKHPQWGAEIIGDNAFYDVAREVALNHHERWDGSGYPRGLKGDEIPLAARIVSVADVYDALTTARPYKAAWPPERALVELMRMRERTLCPQSVDLFMELWREGEIARIDAETEDERMEFDFRNLYAA
jgi:diguanylate cyclase (GGDEF)-like protein